MYSPSGQATAAAPQTAKQAVALATAAALPANTYNLGNLGVGATLTATANGALTVDGKAVAAGQRILVKDEAAGAHNGIYVVTAPGTAGTPYVLTRAADYDTAAEVNTGDLVPVGAATGGAGSTNDGTVWIATTTSPALIGGNAITYAKAGGAAPTPALSTASGNVAADITGVGALATILTTPSLAIGTWLVTWAYECQPSGANQEIVAKIEVGTATATFAGPRAGSQLMPNIALEGRATVTALVTITAAGTLLLQAQDSGGVMTVRATTEVAGYTKASGYTAVKVA